jgi:hypothetical protein
MRCLCCSSSSLVGLWSDSGFVDSAFVEPDLDPDFDEVVETVPRCGFCGVSGRIPGPPPPLGAYLLGRATVQRHDPPSGKELPERLAEAGVTVRTDHPTRTTQPTQTEDTHDRAERPPERHVPQRWP